MRAVGFLDARSSPAQRGDPRRRAGWAGAQLSVSRAELGRAEPSTLALRCWPRRGRRRCSRIRGTSSSRPAGHLASRGRALLEARASSRESRADPPQGLSVISRVEAGPSPRPHGGLESRRVRHVDADPPTVESRPSLREHRRAIRRPSGRPWEPKPRITSRTPGTHQRPRRSAWHIRPRQLCRSTPRLCQAGGMASGSKYTVSTSISTPRLSSFACSPLPYSSRVHRLPSRR